VTKNGFEFGATLSLCPNISLTVDIEFDTGRSSAPKASAGER
jgi:hypothetical protein